MTQSDRPLVRHRYAVLTALGLVMWVAFLGARSFWYPDEPDIAEVCLAMWNRADWIVPYRNGVPWVDYPPLLYWVGCLAAAVLGGVSEFALRLPSALAAIALALATCAVGSRAYGARAGLWSGVLLMTYVQFAFNATSYRTDMLLAACIGAGTLLHAAGSGSKPRLALRVAGFALFGLGILVKGPIGVLLPGLVLTIHHLSRRELRRTLELAPLALVAVAVAAPWFLLCAEAMPSFWEDIHGQNFRRAVEEQVGRGHIQPWYYYFVSIWSDLAPWSPLLPFAIVHAFRDGRARERWTRLALIWFLASFAFWSAAKTKRQLYLLPAYPAIALLMGSWIAAAGATARSARVFTTAAWILFVVVGPLALAGGALLDPILAQLDLEPDRVELARGFRVPVLAIGAVVTAGGLWVRARPDLARIAAVSCALYVVVFALVYPAIDVGKTYAPQCAWLRERAAGADRIGLYYSGIGHHKKGAFAYYTGTLIDVVWTEEELRAFFDRNPDSIAVVYGADAERLLADAAWRDRVLREMRISNRPYVIFGR